MNLINTISSTNFILDNEKENIIKLLSQKRTIQKAIFRISSIKNQKINNIEIFNYFNKNKNKFYNLKKFKISYIHIKPNESNITCDNKEIKRWYIENLSKYSTQEKRNYSIIQIKTKEEALSILSLLKNGSNFSKIAKEKSIEPISSQKGGKIGWIEINLIPKEIKRAHLKYKNQISNVIKFKNEFLIRIKNFKEKKLKKLKDVKYAIINLLKYNKAMQTTKEKVKKILFELNQGNKEILKKENIIFTESETFSRYDHNPIVPTIFSIPNNIKKNKIYTMYQDINKNFVIAFISKIYNENFSENEKKIIIKYLYKNNIEKIFNCIIKNLHKKSKITYRKIENI